MSAPFVLALAMGALGIGPALWLVVGVGLVAVIAFGAVALLPAGATPERHPAALPPVVERG